MNHTHLHDEFQIHLSWTPKINGVVPATPGFYLRALFANEGAATGVVKGSPVWGTLVSSDFIRDLLSLIGAYDLLEPSVNELQLGSALADFQTLRQEQDLKAKRAKLERLCEEVTELEAELGSS